ncbi:hypothetical protein F53441_5962 [Fusarium austroafricanum]|uniref:Type 1 phosphatases regulator n=1 Tax=Fusarium austroafricanum TaxID=2364996 RepID=A0A8H4KJM2_9HYPO|nr:hypothetical protein F53441_5962 [Fusarium austroafricanum]
MSQGQQQRSTPAPSQTQTETQAQTPETREQAPQILRLRGAHTSNGRSVQWAEDVVDNEGLGRKSSKGERHECVLMSFLLTETAIVCCIYHKPKAVDESSDESSSDSDSDSDSSSDRDGAQPAGGKRQSCGHGHGHNHGRGRRSGKGKAKRAPSPNAYEKIPKPKPKDGPPETKS